MLSVTNKPLMLSVVMLNVVMLSVVMLNVMAPLIFMTMLSQHGTFLIQYVTIGQHLI